MKRNFLQRALWGAVAAMAFGAIVASAAVVSELPTVKVGGKLCYYYDVKPKESIYSISNELGVTRQQIVDFNPSAADGLKPRMRLFFPVEVFQVAPGERPAVYAAAAGITTHVVKKGDTVYGVAHKYGMSPDYLIKLNPWAAEGIQEGQTLRITDSAAESQAVAARSGASAMSATMAETPDAAGYIRHQIAEGETLFAISNAHGCPLEAMLDANPTIDPLHYRAGQTVLIPATPDAIARHTAAHAPVSGNGSTSTSVSAEVNAGGEAEAVDVDASPALATGASDASHRWLAEDTLHVAVMLPFMLSEEPQSRTSQLYTEFFKGMLIAADTLSRDGDQPVKISFFDTESSLEKVRALAADPVVAKAGLVVAPDNSGQIDALLDAVSPETLVLNVFAVKDRNYLTHRNVVQVNIPHSSMYDKAINAFVERYSDRLPVFISRTGGQADKDSFVTALKHRLDMSGIAYRDVTFADILRDENLADLNPDDTPLVFVPNSGSKNEFAKYSQAVASKRQGALLPENVKLWGYPEWVTFRGDSFNDICNLGATIYSRFLVDERDYKARDLKERYRAFYGVDMFDAVPTQGILGFDMGTFIIEGLRHKAETGVFPTEFSGIQNALRLEWAHPEDAPESAGDDPEAAPAEIQPGLINDCLFLIEYSPGGFVESEKL